MLCDVTPEAEIKLKLKVYSFGLAKSAIPIPGHGAPRSTQIGAVSAVAGPQQTPPL